MFPLSNRSSWTLVSITIVACLVFAVPTLAAGQTAATGKPDRRRSPQDWREDLRFLAEQMRLKHKSLFHTMTEAEFNQAVQKLDADIPQLNNHQIFVRFLQIMALVQDGHSGFDTRPIPPPDLKDHIPVRFVRYADGIYVRAAAPEYADMVATALEQPDVQRLVIDLRNNTGGDNTLLRPLLVALIRSKVNWRGGIFAITGATTFSAAQNFVNRLENYTEAIYVSGNQPPKM
jgi:hypothetical protein